MTQSDLRSFRSQQQKQHDAKADDCCERELQHVIMLSTPCTVSVLARAEITHVVLYIHHLTVTLTKIWIISTQYKLNNNN